MWRSLFLLLGIFAYEGSLTSGTPQCCGGQNGRRTIWDPSFVAQLLLHASIRCWAILQGPLGQPFAQPTNLLAARLENFGSAWFSCTTKAGRRRCSWGDMMLIVQVGRGQGQKPIRQTWTNLGRGTRAIPTAQKGEGYEDDPEGLLERLQVLSYSCDPYKEDAKGTTMCADYFSSKPHADGVGT